MHLGQICRRRKFSPWLPAILPLHWNGRWLMPPNYYDAVAPDAYNSIRAMIRAVVVGYRHVDSKTIANSDVEAVARNRSCYPRGTKLVRVQAVVQRVPCWPYWRLRVQPPIVVSICFVDFETRFLLASRWDEGMRLNRHVQMNSGNCGNFRQEGFIFSIIKKISIKYLKYYCLK